MRRALVIGLLILLPGAGRVLAAPAAAPATVSAAAHQPWSVDLAGEWHFATGDNPRWAQPAFDDSDWDRIGAPALWDDYGYADYDGYGWYRRRFTAPASAATVPLLMVIGGVDDDDWVYINGRLIGQDKGCYQRRVYHVPVGVVHAGQNLIAVRIFDGGQGGGLAVGPLTLREETLADRLELAVCRIEPPKVGQTEMTLTLELKSKVDEKQPVQLTGTLTDYLQRPLGKVDAKLDLGRGATFTHRMAFDGGECTSYRLSLTLTQGGERWDVYRYLQADALAGPRKTWCLSGEWDFLPVAELGAQPPAGATWKQIAVPMANWGGWPGKEHSAWFRRTVAIPEAVAGQRLVLRFGAVAYRCEVYLNGQRVGGHFGGFEPFSVDVTAAARPGADNVLLVGVTDWTAALKPGTPIPPDPEKLPKGSMLLPFGTRAQATRGIWQDVYLVAHGPVAIEQTHITTSVNRRELGVTLWVHNDAAEPRRVDLRPTVLDAGKPVFALPSRQVTVPAGHTVEAVWTRSWADAKLWWPYDPHLYDVRTEVVCDGTPSDLSDTRFGFREFTIDGKDYRLNGRIFRIRGLLCTPQGASREDIRDYFLTSLHQKNLDLVRNHMGPRPAYYYDIADELGMCLKDESAFYCAWDSYALRDDAFWKNMTAHVEAMVRRSWNHPSVCIWSAENEILHCGGSGMPGLDARIFALGKRMAALDPTRPIEYEGDGDLRGRAATVNLHYPREFGCHDHNLWPNDAWWLGHDGNDRWPQDLIWRGDKPLVIGEFCYYPYSRPPGGVSIFVGDAAYRSRDIERQAHVMGVKFLCEGARWAGVEGLNPWVSDAVYGQQCLPPITAIVREWDHDFWAGERVQRHVLVLNDTLHDEALELVVAVMRGDKPLVRWADSRALEPGGRWMQDVTVQMPQEPGRYMLVAKVKRGSETVHTEQRALLVAEKAPLRVPEGLTVALWDPAGKSGPSLAAAGLTAKPLAKLTADSLAGVNLLIVGQLAWGPDPSAGKDCLPAFVAAGGKVLVLPQLAMPRWLPCGVRVDKSHAATMSYPRFPGHPLLAGIEEAGRDLCWWRDGNLVANALLRKPERGNFRIITEAGARGGLLWTPLLEMPVGRGWWVLSQYLLDDRVVAEPTARRLLQNALDYAASYKPPAEVRVAVLASRAFADYLASLGLSADRLDAGASGHKLSPQDLSAYGLVIAEPAALTADTAAALHGFAEAGGTVWVHCPEAGGEDALRALTPAFEGFGKAEAKGHVTKLADDGLASGLSNSDLFWYREDCWYDDWEGRGTGLIDDPCHTQLKLGKSARVYARPDALAEVAVGRGRVVFDTLRLAEAKPAVSDKARRIGAILLTNLGAELGGGESPQAYHQTPLDLQPWATTGLRDDVAGDDRGGWTDQGDNDLRGLQPARRTLGGVAFDIGSRCIVLRSASHLTQAPAAVAGIKVGARCDALFFLHAAAWATASGETIAACHVRYADGQEEDIPMVDGANVGDWWQPEDLPLAPVGWRGANPAHDPVGLFLYTWRNPRPSVPIATLAVESAKSEAVYLLVAITRGERR